jgi:hypothetical protein
MYAVDELMDEPDFLVCNLSPCHGFMSEVCVRREPVDDFVYQPCSRHSERIGHAIQLVEPGLHARMFDRTQPRNADPRTSRDLLRAEIASFAGSFEYVAERLGDQRLSGARRTIP